MKWFLDPQVIPVIILRLYGKENNNNNNKITTTIMAKLASMHLILSCVKMSLGVVSGLSMPELESSDGEKLRFQNVQVFEISLTFQKSKPGL